MENLLRYNACGKTKRMVIENSDISWWMERGLHEILINKREMEIAYLRKRVVEGMSCSESYLRVPFLSSVILRFSGVRRHEPDAVVSRLSSA